MPTRKQRRRREKGRRHEYEYVYVDEEGREVELAPEENGAAPKAARGGSAQKTGRTRTGGREIPPPSWRRVAKRALIFAPLMFITVHFLAGRELDTQQEILQTAFLLLIFLPFSYVLDSMTYRMYRRRLERDASGPAPKKR
jgi:hypothetical protein